MISRTSDPQDWSSEQTQRDTSAEAASGGMRIRPESLKELYTLNPLRALSALAATWSLVAAAVALAIWSHNPVLWLVAIIIVGRCQHALAVVMHDAAHFRLLEDRGWNDFVGQWLCAFPISSNLYAYRNVHLRHHRFLLTDRDPDLSLSRPYPVSWESFRRKLWRDASGVSALVMRGYLTVENGRNRLTAGNALRRFTSESIARRLLAAATIGMLCYAGLGLAFVLLWVVPLLTVYQVILRVRGILEHGAVPDERDGLRNARTIVSRNPVLRFLFGPHHVAYHLEHHLFPAVPHYNLPALHQGLAQDERFKNALVEDGYSEALKDLVIRRARQASLAG